MSKIIDRVRYRVSLVKPRFTRVLVMARPLPLIADERPEPGEDFEFKIVRDPTDRHLRKLEGARRVERSKQFFARGGWVILAIHRPTDQAIGKIWLQTRSADLSDAPAGIPAIKLARDEGYILDLWVHEDFRRQMVAVTMLYELAAAADHLFADARWVYSYVAKENTASRLLQEEFFGLWVVQEFTELAWGPSFVMKVPYSDRPRFGPFSRRGRHSGAGFDVEGRPMGEKYRDFHNKAGFARGASPTVVDEWWSPGATWFDRDHPVDHSGRPARPETLPREWRTAARVPSDA